MKRLAVLVAISLATLLSPFVRAEGAPLTDEYIASIRTGCADALQGILRVQRTEAVTRVNRGREYEETLKLLAAFNSRIVLNKLDAPVLTGTTSQLQTKFSDFQRHYLEYADKMDDTLKINCKDAPVTFYDSLSAARDARARVADDVRGMSDLFSEYQKGLDELKAQLPSSEEQAQ
jgi:hypothetical protein